MYIYIYIDIDIDIAVALYHINRLEWDLSGTPASFPWKQIWDHINPLNVSAFPKLRSRGAIPTQRIVGCCQEQTLLRICRFGLSANSVFFSIGQTMDFDSNFLHLTMQKKLNGMYIISKVYIPLSKSSHLHPTVPLLWTNCRWNWCGPLISPTSAVPRLK